jgi:hypothetical protein
MITRKYPADELTRDPIFLLQSRYIIMTGKPEDATFDGEDWIVNNASLNFPALSEDDLIEQECATPCWRTETVWFTREEAEEWGKNHSYRFGDGRKGTDWQVYCVCAKGELAEVLKAYTV